MSTDNRAMQILRSVDELLRRIQRWLRDPRKGPVVPEDVALAIDCARLTCDAGNVPSQCRDLAIVAVPRLAEEFRGYSQREHGKVHQESGAPGPSFWAAVKAMAVARANAEVPQAEQREPVADLISQGVTHEQIARHIYGRRGVGPLLQPNGLPDATLIEREAREPGSVIPPGWIPPWRQESAKRRSLQLQAKLQEFDRQEQTKTYDDPATVEDLLRDGAFIQQIERAKGVSRDQILETAREIGVTPVDGPGYHPGLRDLATFDADEDNFVASVADRQALRQLVLELYSQSGATRSATDICAELRKLGHIIRTNTVSAIIGHSKRKSSKADAAVS